jgi:hypothetical protein
MFFSPTFNFFDRPYHGRFEWVKPESDQDRAIFSVRLERSPTEGINFAIDRSDFVEGNWVGGIEPGLGLSALQGGQRISVYLDHASNTTRWWQRLLARSGKRA